MSDTTTKLPHCPRCGHDVKQYVVTNMGYGILGCVGCGFGDQEVTHGSRVDDIARRLIRAELARQALDARAIWKGDSAKERIAYVLRDYVELGQHPLLLPEEES